MIVSNQGTQTQCFRAGGHINEYVDWDEASGRCGQRGMVPTLFQLTPAMWGYGFGETRNPDFKTSWCL